MGPQTPDKSLRVFAARALMRRLTGLTREIRSVREARDPEAVHRMRVASRRLRGALEVFAACFPRKSVRRWNKRMRALRRALGEARDTDVRVEFVSAALGGIPDGSLRPGVERLLLRLKQRRDEEQQQVLRALESLQSSGVIAEMKQALRAVGSERSPRARSEAARSILPRLDALLALEPCVREPGDFEAHHRMRIAAKGLRYTVEIFEPLFADTLTGAIAALRGVQDALGEIHDCDVWSAWLPVFEAEERERTLRYFGSDEAMRALIPGLSHLREEREERRRRSFSEFAALWVSLRRDGVFDALRAAIEPGSGASATSD